MAEDGPLMLNNFMMHINSVVANQNGMYISGALRTGGMLHFNGKAVNMSATLPRATHNAQPYRDGVLFNDTEANAVRFASRDPELRSVRFRVPAFPVEQLTGMGRGYQQAGYRASFVRARAMRGERRPDCCRLFALDHFTSRRTGSGETALSVTLSTDVRNAIHGLEVWPYEESGCEPSASASRRSARPPGR